MNTANERPYWSGSLRHAQGTFTRRRTRTAGKPYAPDSSVRRWVQLWRETGDQRYAEKCVQNVHHMAALIANRIGRPCPEMIDDLLMVALEAAYSALQTFDLSRGTAWITYATGNMRARVDRYFADNCRTVQVPYYVNTDMRAVLAIRHRLECEGIEPTDEAIAERFIITREGHNRPKTAAGVRATLNAYERTVTVTPSQMPNEQSKALASRYNGAAIAVDFLGAVPGPVQVLVTDYIARQPERVQTILRKRLYEGISFEKIGKGIGLTRERVHQIQNAHFLALRKEIERLNARTRDELGEPHEQQEQG